MLNIAITATRLSISEAEVDAAVRAIDVHGFGGGFTLGMVQAGFDLVAKKGREVGFGVLNVLANRDLIPGAWEVESGDPDRWLPQDAELVFGNPPCSGFSTLSPKHFRGTDSKINDCMWELVRYAGRVAPQLVIFESVQQAYTQGRSLMTALRAELEAISGHQYILYHVLHNNASLGGASVRRRYFWVAARMDIKFGVESNATRYDFATKQTVAYPLQRVPRLREVLQDLEPLGLTMQRQAYRSTRVDVRPQWTGDHWEKSTWVDVSGGSWWTRAHMHDGTGTVDGHDIARSPTGTRIVELLELEDWDEGERMSDVMRRYWKRTGEVPPGWHYRSRRPDGSEVSKATRLVETDFAMGHNQPSRWRGDRMARVVTGGGVHLIVHPNLPRTLTQREVARIQGFPDAWQIWPVRYAPDLGPGWGKGVPVHAGRWIADWARRSLMDEPGSLQGESNGERERVINVTNDYRPFAQQINDFG